MKELIQKFNQIKATKAGGNPDRDWLVSNREILMSQIRPNTQSDYQVEKTGEAKYYFQYFNNVFQQSVLKPALASFVLVLMMLGYTATNSIAGASLPGDMLYPIKTAKEKVQLAMALSDEDKIELQMSFITKRADELQQIANQNQTDSHISEQIRITAQNITENAKGINSQFAKIATAAGDDKEKVVNIAKEIDSKTLQVKQAVINANSSLSDSVKVEVYNDLKTAIDSTKTTGSSALTVIVDKYESGEVAIDGKEVAERVALRIKDAETGVQNITEAVKKITDGNFTISLPIGEAYNSSSTDEVVSGSEAAQTTIGQAKDLLDKQDFSSALEQITKTDQLINIVNQEVQAIVGSGNSTTTGQVLGDSISPISSNLGDNSSSTVK